MNNVVPMPVEERSAESDIAERAAMWLEALKKAGPRERREFADWLRQSPAHVRLFLEMAVTETTLEQAIRQKLF